MNINQLIENEQFELKKGLPSNQKLATEIVALANTRGGRILVGYDEENKEVIGFPPDQRTEELISNIVVDCCSPGIDYIIADSHKACKNRSRRKRGLNKVSQSFLNLTWE